MYLLNGYTRLLCTGIIILFSLAAPAANTHEELDANKIISQIYHNLNHKPTLDMPTRIEHISAQFLGKPYLLGALGEGANGDYDQWPLYRTDAFDCETYVDTVLAIALADNSYHFKQCINQVRYQDGHVSYIHRNHFTCLDWNKNNQQQHFIKDITTTLRGEHDQVVVKYARALIDKPAWYDHKSLATIRLNHADLKEQARRVTSLQQAGKKLPRKSSIIAYIPLTALFDPTGQANKYLFAQIPHAAIVEIIRPNWNLNKEIGTNLNVSHLGFVFWEKGIPLFREASSAHGRVVDVPFIDYLRDAMKSPTIKGINVQIVMPQQNGSSPGCK